MKSYDYIVFDVDGTLLDTEYSIIKSLQRLVFQIQGRTIREEELQFVLGITGSDALTQLGIEDTKENFDIWNAWMNE